MNYNYILLPDGTLKSAWFDRNDTPVLTMDRDTKEIVIPDGVKFIAEDAFRAQQQLESVYIIRMLLFLVL